MLQVIVALAGGGAVGSITSLVIAWIRDRRQERGDAGLIFQQALDFIGAQNVKIAELRESVRDSEVLFRSEMRAQEERLHAEINNLEARVLELVAENAELKTLREADKREIAKLKAQLAKYEKILLEGPAWARQAAKSAGLDEDFNAN